MAFSNTVARNTYAAQHMCCTYQQQLSVIEFPPGKRIHIPAFFPGERQEMTGQEKIISGWMDSFAEVVRRAGGSYSDDNDDEIQRACRMWCDFF